MTSAGPFDSLRLPGWAADRLRERDLGVIVTGSTGWLGRATLAALDDCFGEMFPRRVRVFSSRARPITLPSGRVIDTLPLAELGRVPKHPCLILHYAFLGKERTGDLALEDFVTGNQAIGDFLGEQIARLRPEAVFVPSSGAVYRGDRSIDDDLARNPYGVMKARDERKFRSLSSGTGIPIAICRVFNLGGPCINKVQSYALSSILLDVMRGGPIVLRSARPVFRSYLHIGDLCNVIFALLLSPAAIGEAPFDTAGELTIEVGDLAVRARALLSRPDVTIERPPIAAGDVDCYVGDRASLGALMQTFALAPRTLNEQIGDTARFLRHVENEMEHG